MPITSFTIDGVEVNPLLESFEIRETSGGISTMVCDVISLGSPVQRFALHDEVIVEEDTEVIFAGQISQLRERGFGAPNLYNPVDGAPEVVISVTCEDFNRLAERVYATETVTAGTTLAAFLGTLVTNYLTTFGVTLSGSQSTGPNLPDMDFALVRVSDVLQALSDTTGFVWRIDYLKVLRMWQTGDLVAPFDIDEADVPAKWTDDVEVEIIGGDSYANRVTVITGLITDTNHTETFVADGTQYSFPLNFTLTRIIDYRVYNDGIPETLDYQGVGFDLAVHWLWYASDNTIRRLEALVPDPPAAGNIITITFEGTFTATATAEDAAAIAAFGLFEYVEVRSDITTQAAAQALADALLAEKLNAAENTVTYHTRKYAPTLHVGQQQTLTAPARNVSGLHLITDMRVRAETPVTSVYAASGLGLIRTIVAKSNPSIEGKWQTAQHTYRDWLEGGQSAPGVTTIGPTPSSAAPGLPDKAVQFNDTGAFGGDSDFIYYKDQNSVVCGGGGSSITAPSFESCQVFGYNNHIA